MRVSTPPTSSNTLPDLTEVGETSDLLARHLWRIANGDNASNHKDFLSQAEYYFRDIAEQLREPYFARPTLALPLAVRFAYLQSDNAVEPDMAAQRERAMDALSFLADGLASVIAQQASPAQITELAELFDLLGSTVAGDRATLALDDSFSWASE